MQSILQFSKGFLSLYLALENNLKQQTGKTYNYAQIQTPDKDSEAQRGHRTHPRSHPVMKAVFLYPNSRVQILLQTWAGIDGCGHNQYTRGPLSYSLSLNGSDEIKECFHLRGWCVKLETICISTLHGQRTRAGEKDCSIVRIHGLTKII